MFANTEHVVRGVKLLGLWLALAAFACGERHEPLAKDTRRVAQAIVGGAVDTDARFAVAICEGDDARSCSLTCSGALLAPNLVLTARHCLAHSGGDDLDCATDVVGNTRITPSQIWVTAATEIAGAKFVGVERWDLPASRAACGHDLAILTLAQSIAESEAQPVAPLLRRGPNVGGLGRSAAIKVVGFGAATTSTTGGLRRSRAVELSCFADDCAALGQDLMPSEFLSAGTACPGDSGSGAFVGPSHDVLGVLSRTLGASSGCGIGVYSRLDQHALLLARAARAAATSGGYATPSWALEAETLGNAGGGSVGDWNAPCDADIDCRSGLCRSSDDGRRYACTVACDSGCPAGSSCTTVDGPNGGAPERVCFASKPAAPRETCAAGLPRDRRDSPSPLWVSATLAALCYVRRRLGFAQHERRPLRTRHTRPAFSQKSR